jgi:hypothetical protein
MLRPNQGKSLEVTELFRSRRPDPWRRARVDRGRSGAGAAAEGMTETLDGKLNKALQEQLGQDRGTYTMAKDYFIRGVLSAS